MSRWSLYNQDTKNNPPRELYVEALKFIQSDNVLALDIGAGACNETKDMLSRGFNVVAIDSNREIQEIAAMIGSTNLTAEVSNMEDYSYGNEKYDFIIAMFALPFIEPSNSRDTFSRIIKSLKPGGIFAFQLFGSNDEWATNKNMTFFDEKSAKKLFGDNKQLLFKEVEYDGKMANGSKKHWHVMSCIVERS